MFYPAKVAVLAALLVIGFSGSGCRKRDSPQAATPPAAGELLPVANAAQTAYENREAEPAVQLYEKAVALRADSAEMRLNLANAYLLANRSEDAIREAQETLKLEPSSASAFYVLGCAHLRMGQWESALKALQQSNFVEPGIAAVNFQLAVAQQGLGTLEDAAASYQEALRLDPLHPGARYALSQVYLRLKRREEAMQEMEKHKATLAERGNVLVDVVAIERSKHTRARPPAADEQPSAKGIAVKFSDATTAFFGADDPGFQGPVALVDLQHDGRNSIFARERDGGFRLLVNDLKSFRVQGDPLPALEGTTYHRALVGDLDNDRSEDVLMLSDRGTQVFRFSEGGAVTDVTESSGLAGVGAVDGALSDLDFTGKLGLVAVTVNGGIQTWRNQGKLTFSVQPNSGVPASLIGATQIISDDWNGDDLPDVLAAKATESPLLLLNRHGGPLDPQTAPEAWPAGGAIAVGDLNNDTINDLVVLTASSLECILSGMLEPVQVPLGTAGATAVTLVDYDNDGWLDLFVSGTNFRAWRNLGRAGFRDATADLGLGALVATAIQQVYPADFDSDGDTDLLLSFAARGLKLLRNEGGNANHQIKIRLTGNRSNASGIGTRLVLTAGAWHTSRTVRSLPVEIGTGKHAQLDSISIHWSDIVFNVPKVQVAGAGLLTLDEVPLPTGSCPNLYTWDGTRFRYVTDFLGAAPLGLRITDDRFIDADTEELAWIGNDSSVQPRDGSYVLQLTDELREVLYLDEAKLVVADHGPDTEVFPTSKLRPGKPYPPHELVALSHRRPLQHARRSDDLDVTALLLETDQKVVSPIKLRRPQLRGLAEPSSITLDFGPLETERPLVLALTGWLRFGGGMANVAASHDRDLPFPFPTLEVETDDGAWNPVDVVVGAPAGKTKRIFVDLAGKLPAGARRLRLTSAFEIHWDRIALFERAAEQPKVTTLTAATADLHWHGFSEYEPQTYGLPLTSIHEKVVHTAPWFSTLSGWATRYGDVRELLAERDNALLLLASGDEVTLTFPATDLPARIPGGQREFFLLSSGWDKDGDYHVQHGNMIEPLPYQGMDDQRYGLEPRPPFENDAWIRKYNTRWVGPRVLTRQEPAASE